MCVGSNCVLHTLRDHAHSKCSMNAYRNDKGRNGLLKSMGSFPGPGALALRQRYYPKLENKAKGLLCALYKSPRAFPEGCPRVAS